MVGEAVMVAESNVGNDGVLAVKGDKKLLEDWVKRLEMVGEAVMVDGSDVDNDVLIAVEDVEELLEDEERLILRSPYKSWNGGLPHDCDEAPLQGTAQSESETRNAVPRALPQVPRKLVNIVLCKPGTDFGHTSIL